MDKATYEITIESPHGKRAIENFEHWLGKVSDEAKERWGIDITKEKISEQSDQEADFQRASEHD
ncbi:MAG: hypothetical protein ABEI52_08850 [Halobacteriaceae archaeon]